NEYMQAMNAIWTQDEATFQGQYVNFDPIWSWPKPVQQPRPPVLLGGDVPAAMQRVVEFADEWMPHPNRGDQSLAERVADFHAASEAAGRGRLPGPVYGAPSDARGVEEYVQAAVTRCVFRLPAAGADQVLPALDRAARV